MSKKKSKVTNQQLPQDRNGNYCSWKLAQRWQMLPNQSLPSALTGTEDRTVLYWTEVESGSAKAVEGIDPSVDSLHHPWPNLCWLLFVSVSSSLRGQCCLALALISIRPAEDSCSTLHAWRRGLINRGDCLSNGNTSRRIYRMVRHI